jgi:hypothetical protein
MLKEKKMMLHLIIFLSFITITASGIALLSTNNFTEISYKVIIPLIIAIYTVIKIFKLIKIL